ncbi:hypothetical protein VTN00DRAFT_7039 [Thermoascus crustaceus]|uniref:uncharacterized protein n=1 Tax=Thermoascus crustaceus TaxID=5088 RepID=UPI003744A427
MFSKPFVLRTFSHRCSRSPFQSFFYYSSHSTPRCFSSGARRWAAPKSVAQRAATLSKPASKPKVPDPDEETLKFAGRRPGFGKLERKVAKHGSVVLFKAPSQRSYIIGAYTIAGFCFAYSVYNSNITFKDPKIPLPLWQQALFGGVCVLMSVMGTVFIFKTSKLIRAVTAVNSNGRTVLRFTVRRMVPFRKPFQFDVLPHQIAFSRRLVVSPETLKRQQGVQTAEEQAVSEKSFLKAPIKKLNYGVWKIFLSVRRLFTQEDFILLEVEGQKGPFRMDSNGFVSEDFLVVGNPVRVQYS